MFRRSLGLLMANVSVDCPPSAIVAPEGLSPGGLAAIIVVILILLILLVAFLVWWFCCRKTKSKKDEEKAEEAPKPKDDPKPAVAIVTRTPLFPPLPFFFVSFYNVI